MTWQSICRRTPAQAAVLVQAALFQYKTFLFKYSNAKVNADADMDDNSFSA
jgi:hypothetical protein